MEILDSVVIGAGQAGLSSSYHLQRRAVDHLVLDANRNAGGAWQHRWRELTMADVHGIADLPGRPIPEAAAVEPANRFVPQYFAAYEHDFDLPITRPQRVTTVRDHDGFLQIVTDEHTYLARTLINATGTWDQPFVPYYPGAETFRGEQFHTVDYPGTEHFVGKRVLVVGGGLSAVQFLGALRPLTDTLWVTRREPKWRHDSFDSEAGRQAVAIVADRVKRGLPPQSVVSVTGLMLRPQEHEAARLGAYERFPMFERIEPTGIRWSDGRFEPVDAIVWATGFRPGIAHLTPLKLRSKYGGIQLDGVTAVRDRRIQLVGYGPTASTIGANRGGRDAAIAVRRYLANQADRTNDYATSPAAI